MIFDFIDIFGLKISDIYATLHELYMNILRKISSLIDLPN